MRKKGEVSLERALSKLGLASRTQARALIAQGKVTVGGRVTRDPGLPVVPERAGIAIDGAAATPARFRAIVLHKPRGVVTTRSDERGRPTVFSLLQDVGAHLVPVGRLDLATTGLLILTNDTRLADWLTDPKNRVPRTYLVSVRGELSDQTLEKLRAGVTDQDERLRAESLEIRKRSGRETHLVVTLCEGKNREVRRLFAAAGHEVMRLKRVSFGGLSLGELEPGKWRELTVLELRQAFPGVVLKATRENP